MENIMTIEEVANYLKMKPQTIYIWAQKGNIPAVKLGKEWRFRRDVIDEWLNQQFDEKYKPLIEKLQTKQQSK